MQPIVSIVVPVYKIEEYLDKCVQSIINQTEHNIEIILVDDGSPDKCPKMCDDYAASDNRVKVVHKANGGLMSAWIAGTKVATARYMCYVDGDDWVELDMIEGLYRYVDDSDQDIKEIISSNYIIEKKNDQKKMAQPLKPGVYEGTELSEVKTRLLGEEIRPITMSRCMKLISKQLIMDNLKYCNEKIRMAEDVNITLPCMLDAERIVIVEDGYYYHYRTNDNSIVHNYNEGLLDNINLVCETFGYIYKDKGVANGQYQTDREYMRMLFLELKNELRGGYGYIERVKRVFKRSDIREKIKSTDIDINGVNNKLLFRCMKNPNTFNIVLIHFILSVYDMKTN